MVDIKDINHMIVLFTAWLVANVSVILATVIMILQIYILVLKIKKMRIESNTNSS